MTGLCKQRERGRREERRVEGRKKKKGEGRQFSAVQADWMSSSRGTGSSISTTSCSVFLCGCWRLSCGCCSINIIHTHRYLDIDVPTACLIHTHVVVATREEVVRDGARGTEGHRKRKQGRLVVVQTRGGSEQQ